MFVALLVELYGFLLTICLISGWLAHHYPGIDPFSHDSGHLLHALLGWKGDPHSEGRAEGDRTALLSGSER